MAFVVGTVSLRLVVRESHSLKDKRRVVRSLKDRLRQQFNVSVAETEIRRRFMESLSFGAVIRAECTVSSLEHLALVNA